MRDHHRILDEAFIAGQRQRLLAERANHCSAINREARAAGQMQRAAGQMQRAAAIERALEKIDDGTYGLSDVTGRPIPMDRLRTVPEAICTLAEE